MALLEDEFFLKKELVQYFKKDFKIYTQPEYSGFESIKFRLTVCLGDELLCQNIIHIDTHDMRQPVFDSLIRKIDLLENKINRLEHQVAILQVT